MAAASDTDGRQWKRLVLDGSVALAWCFRDEKAPYPDAVLDALAAHEAVVPAVWPYEVANALLVGERRKRSTGADTSAWLQFLRQLPVTVDEVPVTRAWERLLELARTHGLSAYDAAYLELALRLSVPLATLDRRLQAAATAAGVMHYKA
jgi:predicted nucleic acid-binding protein